MLEDLSREVANVGLNLHFGKTKILSNLQVRRGISAAKDVEVWGEKVQVLPADGIVMYLGRKVALGSNYQDEELEHRISKAWGKFVSLKQELCCRHYP